MRLKKEIQKTPVLMIVIVMLIIIVVVLIARLFINDDSNQIINEEPIEIIPYSDYDWSKLKRDKYLTYEDDNYKSMVGIDVAAHQEKIDWKKVKDAGIEFAYIRLGYRGASEGLLHTDLEFENNYKGAIENGIKVGVYWYSQPTNIQEVINEANYVVKVLDGRHIDLPIAYDFEETEFSDGTISRMHGMSGKDRTNMAVTFCNEILKNHYDVMIYTNLYWAETYYDWNELNDYPIWYAQYATYPSFDKPFVMWQYQDDGHVDGIDHDVDLDILFIQKNDQN